MKKAKSALLAASVSLAMAFTLSCSSDDGDDIPSSALKIDNAPSGTVVVSVMDHDGPVTNSTQMGDAMGISIAVGTSNDPSEVELMGTNEGIPTQDKFTRNGTFLVQVSQGTTAIRLFDKVSFKNGGAKIDWKTNYYDAMTGKYIGSPSGGSSGSCMFDDDDYAMCVTGDVEGCEEEYEGRTVPSCPASNEVCDDEGDKVYLYGWTCDEYFSLPY